MCVCVFVFYFHNFLNLSKRRIADDIIYFFLPFNKPICTFSHFTANYAEEFKVPVLVDKGNWFRGYASLALSSLSHSHRYIIAMSVYLCTFVDAHSCRLTRETIKYSPRFSLHCLAFFVAIIQFCQQSSLDLLKSDTISKYWSSTLKHLETYAHLSCLAISISYTVSPIVLIFPSVFEILLIVFPLDCWQISVNWKYCRVRLTIVLFRLLQYNASHFLRLY